MNTFLRYAIFSLALLLLGLLVGFNVNRNTRGSDTAGGLQKLQQALFYIERNYVKDVNSDKLVDDAIKGMLEGLDPHSYYISAEDAARLNEELEGSFEGIGVEFSIVDDTIYVVTPIAGGPSERAGIMAGDRIVAVDGKNIAGIGIRNSDVPKYLKGPKDSKVEITIKRKGHEYPLKFSLFRAEIPLHSVSYSYMVRPTIGYIPVTRFADKTYEEFYAELVRLKKQGMKSLILDLRGNPGGYMTRAYEMADEFLGNGKRVVSTRGRTADSNHEYNATTKGEFEDGAVVVLMDYGSASASEIMAGALQDHDRGLIVGVRSYGKGLVQVQKVFDDGSAMRIVVSEYYTPSGRCIQKPFAQKTHAEYEEEIEERFESGEIYDPAKVKFPDSLKFKTASGRVVYGGGGIYPDVFVSNDTLQNSKYLYALLQQDLFRAFAYHYVDDMRTGTKMSANADEFRKKFVVTPDLMKKFTDYAAQKGVAYDAKGIQQSKSLIENRIKAYIGRRLYQDEGFFPVFHESDNVLQRAIELVPTARVLEKTGRVK